MRYILILTFLLLTIVTQSQTVITVGPGQNFLTIGAAYNSIPATISGPYEIQLMSGYNSTTETWPITFDERTGASAVNTIKIFPAVSNLLISCPSVDGVIKFDGAKYVEFNGSVGGLNDNLDFRIFKTSTTGSAVQFTNRAEHCEFKYCDVSDATLTRFITFDAYPTNTIGSSYNTLSNCKFHNLGTSSANFGVYASAGTSVTIPHRENVIQGCEFYGVNSKFVYMVRGTADWTFSDNHFYGETNSPETVDGIFCDELLGNQTITITNNFFGGSEPMAGGDPFKLEKAITIELDGSPDADILIEGNVITNLQVYGVFAGIEVLGTGDGTVAINNNTIGDSLDATAIVAYSGYTAFYGIHLETVATDVVSLNNNSVGGITFDDSRFYGVYWESAITWLAPTASMNGNSIGGPNPNNIVGNRIREVWGVYAQNMKSAHTTSNNRIMNIDRGSGGAELCTFLRGANAQNNTISNVKTSSINGGAYGIESRGVVTSNVVEEIDVTYFRGIRMTESTSGSSIGFNQLNNNTIQDISILGQNFFYAIDVAIEDVEEIMDNTIRNVDLAGGEFIGILVIDEDFDNSTDPYTTHSISNNLIENIQQTQPADIVYGIYCMYKSDTVLVENNTIRNFESDGIFRGIFLRYENYNAEGAGRFEVNDNLLEDFTNSFVSSSDVTITGIDTWVPALEGSQYLSELNGNTIRNFSMVSSGKITGIKSEMANVNGSEIYDLSNSSNAAISGIHYLGDLADTTYISDNHIYRLSSTYSGSNPGNIVVTGIEIEEIGYNVFNNNLIEALTCSNSSTGCEINGFSASTIRYSSIFNNIIRLGIDSLGVETSCGSNIYGLNSKTTPQNRLNFRYNTVNIAGMGVPSGESAAANLTSENNTLQGNILSNIRSNSSGTGKHYAFKTSTTAGQGVDYNLYHVNGNGGVIASVDNGTTDITSLGDFQSQMIAQNFYSVVGDPLFTNSIASIQTANMSPLAGSPAFNGGVYFPFIDYDYYYSSRGITPTIGAIENSLVVGVEGDSEPGVLVYPNPARDFINLEVSEGSIERINLYNGVGMLVLSEIEYSGKNRSIDVGGLESGVYLLVIETDKGLSTTKLILR